MSLVSLFKGVISLSIMGSVLALVIIVFKTIFKNRINAKWHYYIWVLLIIRLIIPYAPESSFSIFNMVSPIMQNSEVSEDNSGNFDVATLDSIKGEAEFTSNENITLNNSSQQNIRNNDLSTTIKKDNIFNYNVLSIVWLIGVMFISLYFLLVNLKLYFEISKNSLCRENEIIKNFNNCKFEMNIKGNVEIIHYEKINSPCVFGFIRPKLLLPHNILSELSYVEMRYVLLHELSHKKRKDILINYMEMFARVIHWFNPLIWFSLNKMQEDCEIACDAYVLSHIKSVEHKNYGETIINLVNRISFRSWNPSITPMANNKSGIKRRIKMIANFKKKSWKWSVVALIILIGIIITLMTNGNYDIFNNDNSPKVNIGVEVRELTEDEFNRVGTAGLQNPAIDDFRILNLDVEISNANKINNKVLEVPELNNFEDVLNKTGERYWFGSSSYQNNDGEDISQATREIVLYFKGLDGSKLSDLLQPLKIKVGWQTRNGNSIEKTYSVGEQLLAEKIQVSEQDIIKIVFDQLTAEEQESIKDLWQDASLQKVILAGDMGRIKDEAYIGKEVYLINFTTNNKFEPNNMVVYASIDEYKLVGYGYVE
ncbi:M56 family metallopeptidase [Clostridium sp. DL1XJH146]